MRKDTKKLCGILLAGFVIGLALAIAAALVVLVLGLCVKLVGAAATVVCLLCCVGLVGMALYLVAPEEEEDHDRYNG